MVFVNATVQATKKLDFYAEAVYTGAKGRFDPFDLPTPDITDVDANIYPDADSTADYDFSSINNYSDLDYSTWEATFGANYQLDRLAAIYGAVNVLDLADDQPYVYGDLSGSLVTYSAGMSVKF